MSFEDKVVLITGASSGIGAATAIAFSKEGANVVVVGRNEEKLKRVEIECTKSGNPPLVIRADITNEEEAEKVVKETINTFKKIDILVNNAGLFRFAAIQDSNVLKSYDLVMNTNVRAHIYLTHLSAPFLMKSKGNIINISSVCAFTKPLDPTLFLYQTSKTALKCFSRAAAAEFAPHGVRVNTVSPGPVHHTDIFKNAGSDMIFDAQEFQVPLGRILEPVEVADIVLYLVSDKAKGITGSDYIIDNGYLLKH